MTGGKRGYSSAVGDGGHYVITCRQPYICPDLHTWHKHVSRGRGVGLFNGMGSSDYTCCVIGPDSGIHACVSGWGGGGG